MASASALATHLTSIRVPFHIFVHGYGSEPPLSGKNSWKEEVLGSDTSYRSEGRDVSPRTERGRRIDTAAWAAFLIWFGASILANVGWGWFLAGLGIIVLVAQAALRIASEKNDGLRLIGGAVFLIAGIWEIFNLRWPLAPLLVILLGVGRLWRAFYGGPRSTR